MVSRRTTGKKRAFYYACLKHHKSGACENGLVKPIECVDAAVSAKLSTDVLRPAMVKFILDGVFDALQPKSVATNVATLNKNLKALDLKIARLTASIEDGAALGPIVAKLRERQVEREGLVTEIGAADAMANLTLDRKRIEQQVLADVANWRELLNGDVTERRRVLREILDGPIYFTPEGTTYQFEGSDRRGRLIADRIAGSTFCGVPTGI